MTAHEITARVDALERALAAGGPHLPPEAVTRAQEVLTRTRERFRFGSAHTVIALAGSTGSGKSSLFNALARLDVSQVGSRRPTTSVPTACVWGPGADGLLDWLEVPHRHRTNRESALDVGTLDDLHGLVLLDLPDHDSTEVAHRLQVDRLVGLVDLLVWVVDPQKYADELLHHQYLRPLAGHQDVMVVTLNQVDRVAPDAVDPLRRDLARLLAEDGLDDIRVLTTSVRTGHGLDDLRTLVAGVVRGQDVAVRRAAADLDAVAADLREGVAAAEADPRTLPANALLVDALAGAAGVPAVLEAVEGDYRRQAVARTGWPFTRWTRRLRPDPLARLRLGQAQEDALNLQRTSLPDPTQAQRAQVELATRRIAEAAGEGLPRPWALAVRGAAHPPTDDVADALDQAVLSVGLERRTPWWCRVVGAAQYLLAAAAVVGLAWLAVLFVVSWLRLPDPPTPTLGAVPWPTVLLLGGVLLGLLLAVASRPAARVGARRRRRRTEHRLRAAIHGVARDRVLDPVGEVLDAHRTTRTSLGLR